MTDEVISELKAAAEWFAQHGKNTNTAIIGICNRAVEVIKNQKAENAELLSELTITKNNFDNAKERYDEAVKIGQKMNDKLVDAYKKLQTAKSEAIKEFAERLKAVSHPYADTQMVFELQIDNLVKEMTSDNFTKIEHNSLCETETYEGRGVYERKVSDT